MTLLAAARFENFGASHLAMLAVFVLGIWPVVALGRHVRGTPAEMRVSRIYAVLIPCFTIPVSYTHLTLPTILRV